LHTGNLQAALLDRLTRALGKNPKPRRRATSTTRFPCGARGIDLALADHSAARREGARQAHLLSLGRISARRSLFNALAAWSGNLLRKRALRAARHGLRARVYRRAGESIPAWATAALGRLAACFLDSLATLQYPAVGYGIRYDYGIFTQVIGGDGAQREVASSWLRLRNVWETPRGNVRYIVRSAAAATAADAPDPRACIAGSTPRIYAIGFDQLIPGNRGPTVNHLRLWSAAPSRRSHRCVQRGRLRGRGAASRSTRRICRACCIPTIPRRRARSCAEAAVFLREREPAGHPRDAS
jgi:glycogen phosphorylase